MRYLPLVLANLGRHKRRTFLTAASVALALFLFASLRTVVTTIAAGGQFGSAHRLVVTNATGIVFPLPLAYAGRLRALPGVQAVSWANWFGGRYGDGKRFFATFAVDPASYLDMYPEIVLPADQRDAFLRERSAAIVGRRLLDVFGWHLGQDVTLQGTIFSGDWTFTIRGVYTPSDPVINDDMLIFRHDYRLFGLALVRAGDVGGGPHHPHGRGARSGGREAAVSRHQLQRRRLPPGLRRRRHDARGGRRDRPAPDARQRAGSRGPGGAP